MKPKKLKQMKVHTKNHKVESSQQGTPQDAVIETQSKQEDSDSSSTKVSVNIKQNEAYLKKVLQPGADVIYKHLDLQDINGQPVNFLMVYIKGLTMESHINEYVVKPLRIDILHMEGNIEQVRQRILSYVLTIQEQYDTQKILEAILEGHLAIFIEGYDQVFLADIKYFQKRAITVPQSETILGGPQEAFIEDVEINVGLVRKRIRDIRLKILWKTIGEKDRLNLAVLYLEGVAEEHVIKEIEKRLDQMKADEVAGMQALKKGLSDNAWSIFPQVMTSERPDRIEESLLQGKVSIIVDGTPFVMILPAYFTDFLASMEDANESVYYCSIMRLVRMLAAITTLILSPLYVALLSFHYELLHPDLLVELARYRSRVPFPPLVEAIIMEGIADLIREASARLPKQVAPTIGIVGALILGQASVTAGIVSPIMILVVAVSTIVSSVIPDYSFSYSVRILRYVMLLLSGILGAYGISIGLIFIMAHLVSLTSMGYGYYSPIAPARFHDWKNTVVKFPSRKQKPQKKQKGEGT